jgi:hypothetical protein
VANGRDTAVKYMRYPTCGAQEETTGKTRDLCHRTCGGCGVYRYGCGVGYLTRGVTRADPYR